MFTDTGFSVIRNWLVVQAPYLSPGSMLVGEGSTAPAFTDTDLVTQLDDTEATFSSRQSFTDRARFEYLVESGDCIGSVVREIGLFDISNGNMFWRDVIPDITLNGSVELQNVLHIDIN